MYSKHRLSLECLCDPCQYLKYQFKYQFKCRRIEENHSSLLMRLRQERLGQDSTHQLPLKSLCDPFSYLNCRFEENRSSSLENLCQKSSCFSRSLAKAKEKGWCSEDKGWHHLIATSSKRTTPSSSWNSMNEDDSSDEDYLNPRDTDDSDDEFYDDRSHGIRMTRAEAREGNWHLSSDEDDEDDDHHCSISMTPASSRKSMNEDDSCDEDYLNPRDTDDSDDEFYDDRSHGIRMTRAEAREGNWHLSSDEDDDRSINLTPASSRKSMIEDDSDEEFSSINLTPASSRESMIESDSDDDNYYLNQAVIRAIFRP